MKKPFAFLPAVLIGLFFLVGTSFLFADNTIPLRALLDDNGKIDNPLDLAGEVDFSGFYPVIDECEGLVFLPLPVAPGWNALGTGVGAVVRAVAVSGSNVYVGGSFLDAGGIANADYVARWDGSSWNALGTVALTGAVRAIAISGSDVYVGGVFLDAGGNANADRIARWNGSSWNPLGTGFNELVHSIAISGSDVYVGGRFTNAGGNANADYIARWDGSSWNALGTGLNLDAWIVVLSGSNVYVGGDFTNAGGNANADYVARWDGSSWNALGTGLSAAVQAIAISGSNVYVGGGFLDAGGNSNADRIARWDGSSWNALGSGLGGIVYAIAISGSNVYVGGDFTNAGGNASANRVARWDGSSWNALGSGLGATSFSISISGSDVYVGGNFTDGGGNSNVDRIGRWEETGCATPTAYSVTGGGASCSGGTGVAVSLDNSQTGVTYQLMNGASTVGASVNGTGTILPFGNQMVAGTYTVVATRTTGGCTATMPGNAVVTVTPTVTPSVTITANPGNTITTGTSVIFTASPTNGGATPSYQWKKNGTDVGMNQTTYTDASLVNGDEITCVMTSNATCISTTTATSNTITMTVNAACVNPTITTEPSNATVCAGTDTSFTIVAIGATTYQWQLNTGSGFVNINDGGVYSNTTTTTLTITGATAGMNGYFYRGIALNGSCATTSNQATITVNTIPATPGTISGPTTICSGSSNMYSVSAVPGATSYTWVLPGGWTGTSTTSSINTIASATSGNISVKANNSCGSSVSSSLAITVNIVSMPSVTITANPGNTITAGTSVTFTASPTNGGVTPSYQWKKNGTDVGMNQTTYTDASLVNGDEITCVMTSNAICVSTTTATSNTITMTVNAACVPPTTYNITGGGAYCLGGSGIAVGLASSETGVTYQLMNGASTVGTPVAGTGLSIPFGNQIVAATFTVVATRVTGGCTETMTGSAVVTVNNLPIVSITGSTAICVGTTTTLSPTTGGTWTSSNTSVATVTDAGIVTGVSGGMATFTFMQTSTGCTSLATSAVTVNQAPTFSACPSGVLVNVTSGCTVAATYTATAPLASSVGYSFTGATTGSGSGTGTNSNFKIGTTMVTLTATNSCGTSNCSFNVVVQAAEINVQGNGQPIMDGSNIPTTANHTDFGTVTINTPLARTFTIQNTGGKNMAVTSIISNSSSFVVSGAPTIVNANSSATFVVTFTPTAASAENAVITVNNEDCDESIYDFTVTGTGGSSNLTLGNYALSGVSVVAGKNTTVTPDATPANATRMFATANSNFTGILAVDPMTGVVRITNAYQTGTYTVTVTAVGASGSTTKTFTLVVTDPSSCSNGYVGTSNPSMAAKPNAVAIGDFNGDGHQDLATTHTATMGVVNVRLSNGTGGFTSPTSVSVGNTPNSIAVGDFNGDGRQDIAVVNHNSHNVSIRLGNGSGGFSGTTNVSVGSGTKPFAIATGDFDGDGKLDFATSNFSTGNVSIRLGDGLGGFSGSGSVMVGSSPYGIVAGDFDGDGKIDLATANNGSNTVSIRLGDGLGGFSGTGSLTTGTLPTSLAVGDFNADGKQDLVVANSSSNNVSVYLGDGTGAFTAGTPVSVGMWPNSIKISDFNGDGKQDIITANGTANNVSIRYGDGTGAFSGTLNVAVGAAPNAVAVGDFNNDGKQDFVTANLTGNSVSVRRCTDVVMSLLSNNSGNDETAGIVIENLVKEEVDKELNERASTRILTVEKIKMSVMPNPTSGPLTVVMELSQDTDMLFTIIDMQGRRILNQHTKVNKGENVLSFDLTWFPSGLYHILAIGKGVYQQVPVVVK